jgi:hypothetical protein
MRDHRQRYYEEEEARSRSRQGDDSRYADRSWRESRFGNGRGRERDIERWEGEGGNTGRTQSGQPKDAGLGPKDCRRSEARIRKEGKS